MPEQHCMRITTVAWVFIEIRVMPARRTMNSMIGRLTSGAERAAMRERKNANAPRGRFTRPEGEFVADVFFYSPSKNPFLLLPSRHTFASFQR